MNSIALGLPALLLALFCLIYSIVVRRDLYFRYQRAFPPSFEISMPFFWPCFARSLSLPF
jgi:hypothetical protein